MALSFFGERIVGRHARAPVTGMTPPSMPSYEGSGERRERASVKL